MKVVVNGNVEMIGNSMDVARLLRALGVKSVDGVHHSTTTNRNMLMSTMHTYHLRNTLTKMVREDVFWLWNMLDKFSLFGIKAHLAHMTNNDFYAVMDEVVGVIQNEEFVWILGELKDRLALEGDNLGQCHKR